MGPMSRISKPGGGPPPAQQSARNHLRAEVEALEGKRHVGKTGGELKATREKLQSVGRELFGRTLSPKDLEARVGSVPPGASRTRLEGLLSEYKAKTLELAAEGYKSKAIHDGQQLLHSVDRGDFAEQHEKIRHNMLGIVDLQNRAAQVRQQTQGTDAFFGEASQRASALLGVVETTPRSQTSVELAAAPVSPEAGKVYSATTQWRGQRVTVKVSFDQETANFLTERGFKLDVEKAALVRDGKSSPLGTSPGWAQPLGTLEMMAPDAPFANEPMLVTEYKVVMGGRQADGSANIAMAPADMKTDLNIFATHRDELPTDEATARQRMEPLGLTEEQLSRKQLAPGVTVSGTSPESISRAERSIREVVGRSLAGRGQQLQAYRTEIAKLNQLSEALVANVRSPAGLAKCIFDIKAAVAPSDPSPWSVEEAMNALIARKADLEVIQSADVEIVVVPKGKHWTSMPQWAPRRDGSEPPESRGVTTALIEEGPNEPRVKHVVFIPEENEGTQRHELVHLTERLFLSSEDRAIVEQSWANAVANRGPFARPYGAQREEYLTTMSELFEGREGPAGVRWLKENVPEIYGVLSRVSGRTP